MIPSRPLQYQAQKFPYCNPQARLTFSFQCFFFFALRTCIALLTK